MKKPKILALSLLLTLSLATAVGCAGTTQTLSGNAPAASTEESAGVTEPEDQETAAGDSEDATSSATADKDAPAGDGTVPPGRPGKGGRTRPGTEAPATGTDSTTSSGSVTVPDKTFTLEELAAFDGRNGNSAYIAIDGTVYDVTSAEGWQNGSHEGYSAGADLTDAFAASPHKDSLLQTLTPVGTLADAS